MSCYKYWGTIEDIANKLSSYGDLDKYGDSALDNVDIDEIIEILDEVEIIAHDKEIDFDSAKHILDDEKMNKALKLIRKFYVYIGARLETENALKILESDNPTETLDSFHFYERYIGLINNESQLAKFSENKTFVFLGSGPLPLTLILFRQKFGCKCIGIEIHEEVAELSRKVIKKLGLDDGIIAVTCKLSLHCNVQYLAEGFPDHLVFCVRIVKHYMHERSCSVICRYVIIIYSTVPFCRNLI